jgi:ABC-type nitrate/sulfonate/bicarbonate transport system substrate-binding protein
LFALKSIGMSLIPLRIGFIPLADCAPLVVAQELGIFEKNGLAVDLRKANGWDQLVSRLAANEVDAAHMLITLVLAHNASPSGWNQPFAYSACLSQHGNGITLSNALWRAGVRDATGLAEYLKTQTEKTIRLGVVHPRSTHEYLLRHWLAKGGLKPGPRIEFVHVPPPEMVRRLRTAEIDGFCVGEPWNQRAVTSKLGYLVALSTDLLPPMNEKVFAIRQKWHGQNVQAHKAALQAILEAAEWLDDPGHRDQAVEWIASKRYVNSTKEPIRAALSGQLLAGGGRILSSDGFLRFSGEGANYPDINHARYYAQRMYEESHLNEDDLQRLDMDAICMGSFFKQSISEMPESTHLLRLSPRSEWPYPEFLQSFPAA